MTKEMHSIIDSEIENNYLEKVEFDCDCERTYEFDSKTGYRIEAEIEIYNYCENEDEPIYNYPTHEMNIINFKIIE